MKNKLNLALFVLLSLCLSIPLFAQQSNNLPPFLPCGTESPELSLHKSFFSSSSCTDVLEQGYGDSCENNDASIPALPFPGCGKFRVPIAFRKIAQDDCSGLVADMDQRIDDELCYLNELFDPLNIEFFEHSRPAPICSSDFYNFEIAGNDFDNSQIVAENIPGVINIYLADIIRRNGQQIGGTTFLGGNSNNPRMLVWVGQFGTFPGNSNCGITACGSTGHMHTTTAHEMGHFLGLRHTFADSFNSIEDLADNSLCCTASDKTCDTEPDSSLGYLSSTDCDEAPSCTSDIYYDELGNSSPPYTVNNIMSYHGLSCINQFTPFQKRRMYDGLMFCNTYLCSDVPETYLADVTQQRIEICKDEPLPDITGIAGRCYNWYDGEDASANLIATATSTLTAVELADIVDNSLSGTYTIYMGDANSYQDPPCRLPIEIKVLPETIDGNSDGASIANINTCDSPQDVLLSADASLLDEDCVIGWWITESDPISTSVTDDATFMSALGSANIGASLSNPVNTIIESTGEMSAGDLSLAVDCSTLNPYLDYYATPIAARSVAPIPSTNCMITSLPDTLGVFPDDYFYNNIYYYYFGYDYYPGRISFLEPGTIGCTQDTGCSSYTLNISITGTNPSSGENGLIYLITSRDYSSYFYLNFFSGDTTLTLPDYYFSPCYDPNENGLCIFIAELYGNGAANATLSWELDITYPPGDPGIPFPSLTTYNDCMFGAPVEISCDACAENPIPTVGEWSLIILALILLNLGILYIRQRELRIEKA